MPHFVRLDDIRRGWHRESKRYLEVNNNIKTFSMALTNPFAAILTDWDETRESIRRGESRLSTWAQYLERFEATDPRDKIYGLLGLGSDDDRKVMKSSFDANMPASHVYNVASAWFIRCIAGLLLLQFDIGNRASAPRGEEGETLASWVPDYSLRKPTEDPDWYKPLYVAFIGYYNACGDGKLIPKTIQGNPFPSRTIFGLYIHGIVVDRIAYVSGNPHWRAYSGTDSDARTQYSLTCMRRTADNVATWEAETLKTRDSNPYGPAQAVEEAFRRTIIANRDGSRDVDGQIFPTKEWLDEHFEVFMGRREVPEAFLQVNAGLTQDEALLEYLLSFRRAALSRTAGRNFFITDKGYFGLGPWKSQIGDEICVLEGGMVPFVLRAVPEEELAAAKVVPEERQRFFTVIGESYVHGVSDGEWIGKQSEEDVFTAILV